MTDQNARLIAAGKLSDFERKAADALQAQFGSGWWMEGMHPQTRDHYILADTETQRAAAILTAMQDGIRRAVGCWQALGKVS